MRTRLSTKGQLIIPKSIRDRHGWAAGVELVLEDHGDAVVVRLAKPFQETTLDDLIGCLRYKGPARSLADMEAAIERGVRERRERDRE
jgi:AbrB family looped-hinge helix DNA binding protein